MQMYRGKLSRNSNKCSYAMWHKQERSTDPWDRQPTGIMIRSRTQTSLWNV